MSNLSDLPVPVTREEMYLDAIAKGGGGGGSGSGGGFTLLHGTYSVVQDEKNVTLPITASALYALMQTSCVAFDYTEPGDGFSMSCVIPLTSAKLQHEEGYADVYFFVGDDLITNWIEATDAVLLIGGQK